MSHRETFIPGNISPDDPGHEGIAHNSGNTKADAMFQSLMQEAMARGLERRRHPARRADPHDGRVLRTVQVQTFVPTASVFGSNFFVR